MEPAHRNNSITWSRRFIEDKDSYVILDTETTGLGNTDVILQIAIIDMEGNVLFDSLIRPSKKKRIPASSTQIHGIKMSDLNNAPTFGEIVEDIYLLTKNKTVIIYNEDFDKRLIEQTCIADEVRVLVIDTICAMRLYSNFVGIWSEYHGNYRYQKLEGGDHTALGDCHAVLRTIFKMKEAEFLTDRKGNIIQPKSYVEKSTNVEESSIFMDFVGTPAGCTFTLFLLVFLIFLILYYILF